MFKKILFSLFFVVLFSGNVFSEESVPLTTDSRIRTLVYNPNEVYQLKFHYGFQSFIEFAPDEDIEIMFKQAKEYLLKNRDMFTNLKGTTTNGVDDILFEIQQELTNGNLYISDDGGRLLAQTQMFKDFTLETTFVILS